MGLSQKRKPSTPLSLCATAKKLFLSAPSTRATSVYFPSTISAPLLNAALMPRRCIMKGFVSGFGS